MSAKTPSCRFLGALSLALAWGATAAAQFTTVIDVPPEPDPGFVGSDTQVNLSEGGELAGGFQVGSPDGSSTNAELNIDGGSVGGNLNAYAGGVIQLVDGTMGYASLYQGSQLHVAGGTTGTLFARAGSQILATSGNINQLIGYGGTITVDGGYIQGYLSSIGNGSVEPTVLNVIDGTIGHSMRARPNSVVNISGGLVSRSFRADAGSVVNVSGGRIYWYFAAEGEVNLTGGLIDSNFKAHAGSDIRISGGRVGYGFEANDGSQVAITGGSIGSSFRTHSDSVVRIAGGVYADHVGLEAGSEITIAGDQFLLDGQPIAGLNQIGDTQNVGVPSGSLLSGTLADGTPFAFTSADGDTLDGNLTVERSALPAIGPTFITASSDPVPLGIRTGQTLFVDDGGLTPESFVAGPGSTLELEAGGLLDDYAKAVGATVHLSGGTVRHGFDAMLGSVVNLTGGEVEGGMDIYAASVMQVTGGEVSGTLTAKPNGSIHVVGGTLRNVVAEGGTVDIDGGLFLQGPRSLPDGQLTISGGVFQSGIRAVAESSWTLRGGEFHVDGQPVAGLATPGMTQPIDLPEGSVLTGTLADGTTLAWSSRLGDVVADGVLTLEATAVPVALPITIVAPQDPIPRGLRDGQTLILNQGASLPDRFTALHGSTIQMHAGGSIGSQLELVGAELHIDGGTVFGNTTAFEGAQVDISGGAFNGNSRLTAIGSKVRISADAIVGYLTTGAGAEATIVGGTVSAGARRYPIDVEEGATLFFSGTAVTAGIAAHPGSEVVIAGGQINNELDAFPDSAVELIAAEFTFNGQPIDGLSPGTSLEFAEREGILAGQFVNGLDFEFDLSPTNVFWQTYVDPLAGFTLTQVLPYDLNLDGVVDTLDLQQWQSEYGTQPVKIGQGADGDFDGFVNGADFLTWQKYQSPSLGQTAEALVVPESATVTLLLLGIALSESLFGYSKASRA